MDKNTVKEQVRSLRSLCMDKPDAFTDLYFERKYSDDSCLYVERNGLVVSALQYFLYPLQWGKGMPRQVGFLSGISTHPKWRSQGLIAEVIRKAHDVLYSRGALFSLLIPANRGLFGYYCKYGYSISSYRRYGIYQLAEAVPYGGVDEISRFDRVTYRHFLSQWCNTRRCVVIPSYEDMEMTADVWLASGGRICAVRVWQGLSAIVFMKVGTGGTGFLYELPHLRPSASQVFSSYLRQRYPHVREWHYSSASLRGEPFAQTRVIRAAEALRRYAALHPDMNITFRYVDPDLTANSGYYHLENGRCYRGRPVPDVPEYSPATLTRFLLSDVSPALPFMMED